jgi:hypothetical protein
MISPTTMVWTLTSIMPYPKQIVTMAQNLANELNDDPGLYETRFYMLWHTIINYHFPIALDYGVAPQTSTTATGTKEMFLIVKVGRKTDHIVVVVMLKKSTEETKAEMEKVKAELVEFIKGRFSETQYPTIYGIGVIGFSWTAFKLDGAGSDKPTIIAPRRGNVTSNQSFSVLEAVSDEIHAMTRQV